MDSQKGASASQPTTASAISKRKKRRDAQAHGYIIIKVVSSQTTCRMKESETRQHLRSEGKQSDNTTQALPLFTDTGRTLPTCPVQRRGLGRAKTAAPIGGVHWSNMSPRGGCRRERTHAGRLRAGPSPESSPAAGPHAKNPRSKNFWVQISGEFPMDLGIPPPKRRICLSQAL